MKTCTYIRCLYFLIIFLPIGLKPYLIAQNAISPQIQQLVYSVEGLSNQEQEQLIQDLSMRFAPILASETLNPTILNNISAIISAGIFEQAPLSDISDVAYKAYIAEKNGAPGVYVRDLALIGLSISISVDQLEMAARGIEQLMNDQISPTIIEEFISYALYNGWRGETIQQSVAGLKEGVNLGLDTQRLALTLIISIDKDINQKSAGVIVQEAIDFLKTIEQKQPQEAQRQQFAYQLYQTSIQNGLSRTVAEEIYFTAIEEDWATTTIQIVYDAMIAGVKKGLTAERLATAIIVRLAQADKSTSVKKIVTDETDYVANLERKRTKMIQQDVQKYKRKLPPFKDYEQSYLQPPSKPEEPPVSYFNATNRTAINPDLLWQSIQEFLGPPPTPYRWGGLSRSGIDCSGLVKQIYAQQGIYLPRNSAQQFIVGKHVTDNLQFGDLVFFSKYGPMYSVTHVGIYIGNDRFVHASASRGVTISSLNKGYYRLRFKGAKRPVGY